VGEQVTVSIYLYARRSVTHTPTVEPSTDGFWTYDLLPPDRRLSGEREVVNGAIYERVLLRQFAAFPLRPGPLTIGSMTVRLDRRSLFDVFGGGGGQQSLVRQSAPVVVNAQPLPEAGKPPGDVAVGRFQLTSALDREEVPTGSAVKLSVTVKGEGDIRSLRVALPPVDGLDVLQPEVRDLIGAPGGRVGGTRIFEWLVVPQRPGVITLPSPALNVFDTRTRSYRKLQGPALTLRAVGRAVAAAPAPADAAAPKPSAESTHEWGPIRTQSALARRHARLVTQPLYLLALALPPFAWLATLLLGGVRRRLARKADSPSGRALREARERMARADASAQRGQAAEFHAQAAAAVLGALAARAGSEVHALTHPALKRHLVDGGADAQLADDVVAYLDRCDLARFGSTEGASLQANAAELKTLFERVAALPPMAQEGA
jgi:hypothetical protein